MGLPFSKFIFEKMLPESLIRWWGRQQEIRKLNEIASNRCDAENICDFKINQVRDILESTGIVQRWKDWEPKINEYGVPDGTGGVNPGDRRAVFSLIAGLGPSSVLEIGTHIGASTIHIASALRDTWVRDGRQGHLTTVDINDVNSPALLNWKKHGVEFSPAQMIRGLGCEQFVEFITCRSIDFLKNCKRKFDFIFLDGDHSAQSVYKEIPLAFERLNKDGFILLHDYFPDDKPLWADNYVLHGPYLAVRRLREEGAGFDVIPLANLPWPTKLQSCVTSLALLTKRNQTH